MQEWQGASFLDVVILLAVWEKCKYKREIYKRLTFVYTCRWLRSNIMWLETFILFLYDGFDQGFSCLISGSIQLNMMPKISLRSENSHYS